MSCHSWGVCIPDDPLCPLQPQISFGSILTPIGLFFLTYGFGAFFQVLPGAHRSRYAYLVCQNAVLSLHAPGASSRGRLFS